MIQLSALTLSTINRENISSGAALFPASLRRESMSITGTANSSAMRRAMVVFPTPVNPNTTVRRYGNLFCSTRCALLFFIVIIWPVQKSFITIFR
jgi:hypothetical protein